MAKKKNKKKNKVTHQLAKAALVVTDMSYLELRAAKELYYASNLMHYLEHLMEVVDAKPAITPLEQEAMDLLIERYQTRYKSPLAKALNENKGS